MRSYFGRCMGVVLAVTLAAMFLQPNTHTAFAGPATNTYTLVKTVSQAITCPASTPADTSAYTFSSSTTAVAGQCVVVNIAITNNNTMGGLDITNLQFGDTLPTGLQGQGNCIFAPSGSTSSCTVTSSGLTFVGSGGYSLGPGVTGNEAFVAKVTGAACGALQNTATVTAATHDTTSFTASNNSATATINVTCPTVTTPTITKTVSCTGATSGTNTNTTVGLTTGTGSTICTYTIMASGLASGCAVVQDPITGQVFNVGIVCATGSTVTGATIPVKTQPATFTFQQTYGPFTNCGTAVVQNVADLVNMTGTSVLASSGTVNVTLNVTGCGTVTPPTAVPVIVCGVFQPVTGSTTSIMIGSTMFSIPGGMASLGVVVTPGFNVCFLVIGNTVVGVLTNILTSAHQVNFHYSWKAMRFALHLEQLWRMLALRQ